ncbi:MAG: hypothetical protein XD69_0998 [Clostridia bacterium 62_21]|nr:MAG: hypothetical protein XD69_0998 [Clostridia bacterium 62_21]
MQFYFLLGLLFALCIALFAVQNATPVDIRFLAWSFPSISLSLVILGAVAAGAVATMLLGVGRQYRAGRRIRELTARVAQMEREAKAKQEVKAQEEGER